MRTAEIVAPWAPVALLLPWVMGSAAPAGAGGRALQEALDAAIQIGALVWSATSPDDLADRLSDAVEDERIGERALGIMPVLFSGAIEEISDSLALARGVAAAADPEQEAGLLTDLLEGARLCVVAAHLYRMQVPPPTASHRTGEEADPDLASLPTPVLRAVLAGYKAAICVVALADLVVADRRPQSWLVCLVAHTWADNQRKFLPLPAMGVAAEDLPDGLLPRSASLTEAAVVARHNEGENAFQELIRRAANG